jgi:hypothetical protein
MSTLTLANPHISPNGVRYAPYGLRLAPRSRDSVRVGPEPFDGTHGPVISPNGQAALGL